MQDGNVFAPDTIDRGPWLLYDRLTTAAGSTTASVYNFFSNAISSTKTKSDTNLIKPNSVPPPRAFQTQSIGFYFAPNMTLTDLTSFLKNYYFEFKIGDKVFAEGPMQFFPAGAGLQGFSTTNSGTAGILQAVSNGDPSVMATRRFPDYPRTIPANVFFGVNVIVGASTVSLLSAVAAVTGIGAPAYGGLDVMCVLDGIIDREVQ